MDSKSRTRRWAVWVSIGIGLAVFAFVYALRSGGALQRLELFAYDTILSRQPTDDANAAPVVIVELDEAAIQHGKVDYPITDDQLADVLEQLLSYNPTVIGLDIFRDAPVGVGRDRLRDLFLEYEYIVAITKLSDTTHRMPVPPPEFLIDADTGQPAIDTGQIASNDLPLDPDGRVRRGILFMNTADGPTYPSLAMLVANHYLLYHHEMVIEIDPAEPSRATIGQSTLSRLTQSDGGYRLDEAELGGFQFLLDYRGPRRFHRVTVSELLEGEVEPTLFEDKIVLFGHAAVSAARDTVSTPVQDTALGEPGVVVHGRIADQIVRAALGKEADVGYFAEPVEAGWILFWSLFGALIGLSIRSTWLFVVTTGLGLIVIGGVGWFGFDVGRWVPVVPPWLTWILSAGVVTSYMSYREMRQRGQLMRLFEQHVSDTVAATVWEQRDALLDGRRVRPTEVTATVLFVDIEGFSAIAEGLTPGELIDWLNRYLDLMSSTVIEHDGMVNKYMGDAVLAVFGVPFAATSDEQIDRDARRAVACALDLRRRLTELNETTQRNDKPRVRLRVGIATGPVVAGTLGTTRRVEYSVLGDTVNTAARLESFEKTAMGDDDAPAGCRILIAETTLQRLDETVKTRSVGTLDLKGKSVPVSVHAVLDTSAS